MRIFASEYSLVCEYFQANIHLNVLNTPIDCSKIPAVNITLFVVLARQAT